jgi:hypothetical protein
VYACSPLGRAGKCGSGGQGELQMVSKPTLAVARTGRCAGIWHMEYVGLRWDTWHGVWADTRRTILVNGRTYACACGPGMGRTAWHMVGTGWVSWIDDGVRFFEGCVCVTGELDR